MISTPLDRAGDNKVYSQDYNLCILCSFLHIRAVSSSNTMDAQTGLLPVVTDRDLLPKSVASKTTNIWLATTDCRDVKLSLSARYFR